MPIPSDSPRIPEVPVLPSEPGFSGGVCIVFCTGGIDKLVGCILVAVAVTVLVAVGVENAALVGIGPIPGTVGCAAGAVGAGVTVGGVGVTVGGVGVGVSVGVGVGVSVGVGVPVGGLRGIRYEEGEAFACKTFPIIPIPQKRKSA